MSLQVWLTLNGDLHNQGLSGASATNYGATVYDNGKIGKCYTAPNGFIEIPYAMNTTTSNYSICFWAYAVGKQLPFATNGSNNWNIYFGSKICANVGDSENSYFDASPVYNSWHHYVVSINGKDKKIKLYIDGTYNSNCAIYHDISCTKVKISGWYADINYKWDGYLNDFRIYDHCLSPKEVKEISKGLVLHYPLNQPERSRNLISDTNANEILLGSYPTSSYYLEGKTYTSNTILKGTQYTLSFDAKSTVLGDNMVCHLYNPNTITNIECMTGYTGTGVDGFSLTKVTTEWKRYWIHYTLNGTDTKTKSIIVGRRQPGYGTGFLSVRAIKLEEGFNFNPVWTPAPEDTNNWGLTEWDTSGYGNNGLVTATTAPGWSSDSPRYSGCYNFNGTGGIITDDLNLSLDKYTISFWVKHTVDGKMPIGTYYNGNTGMYWYGDNSYRWTHSTGNDEYYYNHTATNNSSSINQWLHCVATYDGINIKIYRNGSYEGNKNATGLGIFHNLSVGYGYENSSAYWSPMNISDFRLYANCLDSNDVLDLYQTSASIIKET